jgi:hypothetical protein
MAKQLQDVKILKVVLGLALENELYNGRDNSRLYSLYMSPDYGKAKAYYWELMRSSSYLDRETSFWLETLLGKKATEFESPSSLIYRLQRVEAILYDFLLQGDSNLCRALNEWLNYVANTGESLKGGYWLDAKIFANRALDSSERAMALVDSRNAVLRYELGVLRSETHHILEELMKLPLTFIAPEGRLDSVLEVQGALIELLRIIVRGNLDESVKEDLRYSAQKLTSAQAHLLNTEADSLKCRHEVALASEYIERTLPKLESVRRHQLENMYFRLKKLLENL